MLEEFAGIPAHPLLVHAAVVLVPLLAILTIAYAFVPIVRPHVRWVLGLLAVGAPLSAFAATLSGDAFFARMDANGQITEGFYPTIEAHQRLGDLTFYSTIVLGVLTLALVYLVKPHDPAGLAATLAGTRVPSWALGVLSLVAAGVCLYYVVRTGDSGARAVWSGY